MLRTENVRDKNQNKNHLGKNNVLDCYNWFIIIIITLIIVINVDNVDR